MFQRRFSFTNYYWLCCVDIQRNISINLGKRKSERAMLKKVGNSSKIRQVKRVMCQRTENENRLVTVVRLISYDGGGKHIVCELKRCRWKDTERGEDAKYSIHTSTCSFVPRARPLMI